MDVPTRVSAYGLDLKTLGEWLGSSFLIRCSCEVTEEHVFLHCCFLRFSEMRDGHKSLFDSETRDTPKGTSRFLFVFSGADIFSQISPKWEDGFFQARTLI